MQESEFTGCVKKVQEKGGGRRKNKAKEKQRAIVKSAIQRGVDGLR
jgi:hypothetical protein